MPFEWPGVPYPAFLTTFGITLVSAIVVAVAHRFDRTHGMLTLSVLITVAFIAATIASMISPVPQVATTEMLIGALATALGAIVALWLGRGARKDE